MSGKASKEFIDFVNALVEEVTLKKVPFVNQKKWLKKYAVSENLDANKIEKDINRLIHVCKKQNNIELQDIESELQDIGLELNLTQNLCEQIIKKISFNRNKLSKQNFLVKNLKYFILPLIPVISCFIVNTYSFGSTDLGSTFNSIYIFHYFIVLLFLIISVLLNKVIEMSIGISIFFCGGFVILINVLLKLIYWIFNFEGNMLIVIFKYIFIWNICAVFYWLFLTLVLILIENIKEKFNIIENDFIEEMDFIVILAAIFPPVWLLFPTSSYINNQMNSMMQF